MNRNHIIEIPPCVGDAVFRHGMLVKAEEISQSQWPLLEPGIYGIYINNILIIRRIKKKRNKDIKVIKYENPFTGQDQSAVLSKVAAILRFDRIVDAPVY